MQGVDEEVLEATANMATAPTWMPAKEELETDDMQSNPGMPAKEELETYDAQSHPAPPDNDADPTPLPTYNKSRSDNPADATATIRLMLRIGLAISLRIWSRSH